MQLAKKPSFEYTNNIKLLENARNYYNIDYTFAKLIY